ncbi:carboxylesterase family protein [uncultured Sphingomonas sp.]|uniref:carboxylesterase/lipase family protein n=1 Tax=uncultured Sphingomonas sp. TaxID=158754 RepID=UPI0025FFD02D|nr:carboxylesterase family protein [uncultured Sphingomonas sp.]
MTHIIGLRRSVAMLALAGAPVLAAAPHVRVEQGLLAGIPAVDGSSVQRFLGIPYAAPPVGALRWRAPRPALGWPGIRMATEFGARCIQPKLWDDMIFRAPGMGEDCLTLNVWTPARLSARQKLPVLVYVYGGGFLAGGSSEPRYDGASMAARGIVVVTMNYRLGAFGFLAHPELTAGSPHHASGNYGLLDQAAALQWVRRNIAAFGGDPARITVGGESAGSMSVGSLMASPLTRGLIAGAIAESGAPMGPVAPAALAEGEARGRDFAGQAAGVDLAALRALSPERVLELQGKAAMRFGPVIDGYYLREQPSVTFAAGRQARVPLLIGSNSQEQGYEVLLQGQAPTVTNYRAMLTSRYGDQASTLARLYPAASDAEVPRAVTALASDLFLGYATWKMFDLHRQGGAPTFYYYFSRIRPPVVGGSIDTPAPLGALHSAEIEYALGNLETNPRYGWTADDRAVSRTMQGYFANFVRTGNPNGTGLPAWRKADAGAAAGEGTLHRQHIDVRTRDVPLVEQQRYRTLEPLIRPR